MRVLNKCNALLVKCNYVILVKHWLNYSWMQLIYAKGGVYDQKLPYKSYIKCIFVTATDQIVSPL